MKNKNILYIVGLACFSVQILLGIFIAQPPAQLIVINGGWFGILVLTQLRALASERRVGDL